MEGFFSAPLKPLNGVIIKYFEYNRVLILTPFDLGNGSNDEILCDGIESFEWLKNFIENGGLVRVQHGNSGYRIFYDFMGSMHSVAWSSEDNVNAFEGELILEYDSDYPSGAGVKITQNSIP